MDAADAWLREHDPNYELSRKDWKDIRPTGRYETPRQEVPVGLRADDIVGGVVPFNRACDRCGIAFVPKTAWHRFCSEACGKQAARRRAA